MPKTASKSSKVSSRDKKAEKLQESPKPPIAPVALALFSGALFGLSAPGLDQWYLAWFALAPFFLLVYASPNFKQAAFRGLLFGTAYNLVYLNWYLALHPLNWMNLNDWQSIGLAGLSWLIVSAHQGVLFSIFAVLIRALPLCGGFLPRKVEERWKLPALITLPLLYQLAFEKLLNAHDLLGVPWSMIEYSQYKLTAFIQSANLIGGIGVGTIVVAFNVAVATLIATFSRKLAVKPLAAASRLAAACSLMGVLLLVSTCISYGFMRLATTKLHPTQNLAVLQGNINIEMQKTKHKFTLEELIAHYAKLLKKCKPGFCVFTESALPTFLKESPHTLSFLSSEARKQNLDMIVGSIDSDEGEKPYNGAFGVRSDGTLIEQAYHKRYLVPVGEYTPEFVKYLPEFIRRMTDTPAGVGFAPGKKPVVLDFAGKHVAPLICFETIAPELATSSARNGGELIVNISDLAWFHDSIIGKQTEACVIFRAIETGRYFVYAANTGPSLIASPLGTIESRAQCNKAELLQGKVELIEKQTPFTLWYF